MDWRTRRARNFLIMLWQFRIRLRVEADGVTVTPYDPGGRVSETLVEETQKRSAGILPFVPKYIAAQEAWCSAWEAAQGQVSQVSQLGKRRRGKKKMEQGAFEL